MLEKFPRSSWDRDSSGNFYTEHLSHLLFIGINCDGYPVDADSEEPVITMDIFYKEYDDSTPVTQFKGPKVKELYDRLCASTTK